MENVWRDDPVTDGQQGAIRFINANLGMNEHPRTKGEAADYIKAFKEKAEAVKKEREQMKRERLERERLCDPIIERLSKSANPANERPRDKVKFDAEKLFSLAMDAGFRNFTELARKAFPDGHPGEGYILDRIRDYDSTMSKRWLEMICATLGCELEDIMPTEPTKQMEIAHDAVVEEPAVAAEEEVPENCVSFDALGVRFKDRAEIQEFEAIIQILGLTQRDFTTMAFFTMFDKLRGKTVPELLKLREDMRAKKTEGAHAD